MRTYLIFFFVLLFSYSIVAQKWQYLNQEPTGNQLNDILSMDENVWFAVGELGTILKTTDGGETWIHLNSGTTKDLHSIFFQDSQVGYVVGGNEILKTVDGGDSWTKQTVPGYSNYYCIYFPSLMVGYVTGDNRILKTIDGGNNWNQIAAGPLDTRHSVLFLNPDTGFVTGQSYGGGYYENN